MVKSFSEQFASKTGLRTPEEIEEEAIRLHTAFSEFDVECCKENALAFWRNRVREAQSA